jgi:hypothetical protein
MKIFNKTVVLEALKKSLSTDSDRKMKFRQKITGEDSLIPLVIHDVFGGEILKTHSNKYWHFYNMVDGERVDFSEAESTDLYENESFEDIPATTDETYGSIDNADYSTFFMRFVRAFEETIGLDKYNHSMAL